MSGSRAPDGGGPRARGREAAVPGPADAPAVSEDREVAGVARIVERRRGVRVRIVEKHAHEAGTNELRNAVQTDFRLPETAPRRRRDLDRLRHEPADRRGEPDRHDE